MPQTIHRGIKSLIEAEILIEESREAAEPGDLHAAARLEELLRKIRPPEKGGR